MVRLGRAHRHHGLADRGDLAIQFVKPELKQMTVAPHQQRRVESVVGVEEHVDLTPPSTRADD